METQAGSIDSTTTTGRSLQPNFSGRAVQEALEHSSSYEPIELCNEANVERCRATRYLKICGRYVDRVLTSCGHASLCAECTQRYDVCPVCRIPLPKNGNENRLRLYSEWIEAGLVSKRRDERLQERDDGETQQRNVDVQRLYSLFDVALENDLVSLICKYVTDVCMDTTVPSNPVTAFLLDEVVVKDWCKLTFANILKDIYILEIKDMDSRLSLLLKFSTHLAGISDVLEVLDSSSLTQLHDLCHLKESVLKTEQYMEKIIEDVKSVADRVNDENANPGLELENGRGELSGMRQLLESFGQSVADSGNNKQIESLNRKICELLKEKEHARNETQKLRTELSQLTETLREREMEISTLSEECKRVKSQFHVSEANLKFAERAMAETAQDSYKNIDLQETIKGLLRDLRSKDDEVQKVLSKFEGYMVTIISKFEATLSRFEDFSEATMSRFRDMIEDHITMVARVKAIILEKEKMSEAAKRMEKKVKALERTVKGKGKGMGKRKLCAWIDEVKQVLATRQIAN